MLDFLFNPFNVGILALAKDFGVVFFESAAAAFVALFGLAFTAAEIFWPGDFFFGVTNFGVSILGVFCLGDATVGLLVIGVPVLEVLAFGDSSLCLGPAEAPMSFCWSFV